jgi:L-threonylcarbamoyladenylate synthase
MVCAQILKVTSENYSISLLESGPIAALKSGEAIGMPTETVYGLAANCLDAAASESIFRIKNRPMDNPLICHISSLEMLETLVDPKWEMPEHIKRVIDVFWPGPLTLLLPAHPKLPSCVTAGLSTVGVRFPSHPVALELISRAGFPLAAPSANLSGRPSPTSAAHVFADLHDRISWIVDGGSCGVGLESTVVDLLSQTPLILRPGAITRSMLRTIVPDIQVYQQKKIRTENDSMPEIDESRPPTPGMKYKHYAPNAPVWLCAPKLDSVSAVPMAQRISDHLASTGKLVSSTKIIRLRLDDSSDSDIPGIERNIFLSKTGNLAEIAQNLFSALREADLEGPDLIVAETVCEDEEGLAIMNRLFKSAGEEIIYI